ncbi:Uncharacterised protein [uncultured archaeon]|nr:Uncharacterised protein [uncultured archaeon]
MIREIPVVEKKTDDALLLAKKSSIRILMLVLLFVVSARFAPQLDAYSTLYIAGIAGILAFPAAAYYGAKSIGGFLMLGKDNLPAGGSVPAMPGMNALFRMPFNPTGNMIDSVNDQLMPLRINTIAAMPDQDAVCLGFKRA